MAKQLSLIQTQKQIELNDIVKKIEEKFKNQGIVVYSIPKTSKKFISVQLDTFYNPQFQYFIFKEITPLLINGKHQWFVVPWSNKLEYKFTVETENTINTYSIIGDFDCSNDIKDFTTQKIKCKNTTHIFKQQDSTKIDYKQIFEEYSVKVVFADPPYGIGYEYNNYTDVEGDQYVNFLDRWASKIIPFTLNKTIDMFIITPGWKYMKWWFNKDPKGYLTWFDITKQSGQSLSHLRKTEPIIIFGKPNKKYQWDILRINTDRGDGVREIHTCPKPVNLLYELLEGQIVNEKDYVLDPFGGSGTTQISSKMLNYNSILLEIDKQYIINSINRFVNQFSEDIEDIQYE